MRRALAAVSIACLALGASARAGVYVPPPADRYPAWTPDGGSLLYVSGRDGDRAHVIGADGSGDRAVGPAGRYTRVALAPDGRRLAVTASDGPAYSSYVVDGEARLDLGPSVYLVPPSWAPDGRRLAVMRPDRTTVVDAATGAATLELPGLGYAAWSPDGALLAGRSAAGLELVDAAGRRRLLAGGAWCCEGFAWSPDSSRVAYFERRPETTALHLVGVADAAEETLPLGPPHSRAGADLSWTPDGRSLVYAARSGDDVDIVRLDVDTRTVTRLAVLETPGVHPLTGVSFGGDVAVSPDGRRVAFAHGGECRDKIGVHVVGIDGRGLRRLTNDCRITGTTSADRLVGTGLADVLVGLAGNDRLLGFADGYVGDTLDGGDGADTLLGSWRQDVLLGGRGADALRGGPSGDLLVGGPGRDAILGEGGQDVVDAYDGWRDRVSCGTNAPTNATPEHDVAYVDRYDRVSRDCEVVIRRKRLS